MVHRIFNRKEEIKFSHEYESDLETIIVEKKKKGRMTNQNASFETWLINPVTWCRCKKNTDFFLQLPLKKGASVGEKSKYRADNVLNLLNPYR